MPLAINVICSTEQLKQCLIRNQINASDIIKLSAFIQYINYNGIKLIDRGDVDETPAYHLDSHSAILNKKSPNMGF